MSTKYNSLLTYTNDTLPVVTVNDVVVVNIACDAVSQMPLRTMSHMWQERIHQLEHWLSSKTYVLHCYNSLRNDSMLPVQKSIIGHSYYAGQLMPGLQIGRPST
eukprot:8654-Heterococcus_DN1.PRE.2